MFVFWEIWRALFSCKTCFEICLFCLFTDEFHYCKQTLLEWLLEFKPKMPSVHKMFKHTLKILQIYYKIFHVSLTIFWMLGVIKLRCLWEDKVFFFRFKVSMINFISLQHKTFSQLCTGLISWVYTWGILYMRSFSCTFAIYFIIKRLKNLPHYKVKYTVISYTAQKWILPFKDFFSKCDQISSFLRICSHLLKKS